MESHTYFLGESGFSIYVDLGKKLEETGGWKREKNKNKMHRCDVVLGDRFDIPYYLLVEGRKKLLINYFKGSHRLTLKASMAKALREIPSSEKWFPKTFVLGAKERKVEEGETDRTKEEESFFVFNETQNAQGEKMTWIVKPSAGCKGQGVLLSSDPVEIDRFVRDANTSLFVAQRYIERPFLIQGRKFDIRVWALLSAPYTIHIFKEGSCRTASVKYDLSKLNDVHVHLTNHCLQEDCPDFGKYEEGNELWYDALDKYLESTGSSKTVRKDIEPQMANIIVETLLSVRELLEVPEGSRYDCFQLFGYDFILDAEMNAHLLEINGSPGAADKWIDQVTEGMIDICISHSFPSESAASSSSTSTSTQEGAEAAGGEGAEKQGSQLKEQTRMYWEQVYPSPKSRSSAAAS